MITIELVGILKEKRDVRWPSPTDGFYASYRQVEKCGKIRGFVVYRAYFASYRQVAGK